MRELGRIQKVLEFRTFPRLTEREFEIRKEIKVVLKHEFGSRSLDRFGYVMETRTLDFFINIGFKGWCFDAERLKQHAVEFFKNLYTVDPFDTWTFNFYGFFPLLKVEDRDFLAKEVLSEEIHKEVFSMAPLTALGVNGFHAKLYQSLWDIVGMSMCNLVKTIFS